MLLKWYMDGEFVPKDIRKATEILKIYLNKHFENPDTYKPIEDSYSNLGEGLLAELKQQSSHELSSMIEEMLAGKDRKKVLQILCEDYRFDYDIWMSILSEDKIFQYAKELLSVEEENDQAIYLMKYEELLHIMRCVAAPFAMDMRQQ